jgi:uncharacterized membrane protein (DUF485 family)
MNHQEFSQVMSSSEYYFRIKQSNASTEISVLLYCVVIPFCILIDLRPLVLSSRITTDIDILICLGFLVFLDI